jgi:hypothetical protein
LKRDFIILTEIGNLLYKENNKPLKHIENEFNQCPPVTGQGDKGNKFFPLSLLPSPGKFYSNNKIQPLPVSSPFAIAKANEARGIKGSFLNKKTYDYLNSVSYKNFKYWSSSPSTFGSNKNVHETLFNFIIKYNESLHDLRNGINKTQLSKQKESSFPFLQPQKQGLYGEDRGQKESSIETNLKVNDVIYQYLKTFSIFNKRKNGILIQYNQHIAYNFNSQNLLLRGVEHSCPPVGSTEGAGKINKSLHHYHDHYHDNGNGIKEVKDLRLNKLNSILSRGAIELNRLKGVSSLTGDNRTSNNRLIKYSYKLLFYFFKSIYCLISKPVFLFTPDKVIIQLFYFLNIPKSKVFKWYSILNNKIIRQRWSLLKRNQLKTVISYSNKDMLNKVKLSWRIKKTLFRLNKKRNKVKNILFNLNKFNIFKVFSLKFKLICEVLSNKFKKPVELQLIRIHQPFYDSNILVNLLSLNIKNKKFKPNVAIEKLYAKKAVKNLYDYSIKSVNFIPAFLSGIKIRIGGRLMREPIIPRITTKNFERGASSPGKVNFLDIATITKKNRKGSYTIKISSGQNFF